MRNYEQRSRIRYVKGDYVPGTDVLAVESKETSPSPADARGPPFPELDRDAVPGSAILDDPVTDRNGRAPNTPPRSPRRTRLIVRDLEV